MEQRPGASGRRWEARLRAARERREGEASEPSKWERAIAKGTAGEQVVGNALTALGQEMNLGVLHDLALRGHDANIDHLVIGPSGVTVVDAKAWSGPVWIGRSTMRRGPFSSHSSLRGVAEQVARVKSALCSRGHHDVAVSGLLCMVNANKGVPADGLKWVGEIGVGTIPNVRRYVARDGDADLYTIRAIHEGLAAEFVVSGGGFMPSLGPPGTGEDGPRQPDLVDKLIAEINAEHRRGQPSRRRARFARAMLGAVTALIVAGASLASLQSSPDTPPALTRAELDALRPELRALAQKRAKGRVGRPNVRAARQQFVLRYRRGTRCRVRITVDRESRARSVRASGCRTGR